jgi:dehydrogenase/reductase SDR family protein 7B
VHAADLSTKEGSRGLVAAAEQRLGGIDFLILNHIIGMYDDWARTIMRGHDDETLDVSLEWVDKVFRVNILSYIYLSSYALPALARSERGGRIIAVGSGAGKSGFPRVAPYSSTKHAVFGYFDSLRQDLVESADPALRRVGITQGVLGAFTTESFKTGTAGKLDPKFIPQNDPSVAAWDLLKGGARGYQTIYTPWSQVRLVVLLQGLMPRVMDAVLRKAALAGEV